MEISQDVVLWQRQTYSVLDFLGDLGGLFDALRVIGGASIAPFSKFIMQVTLMVSLFKPKGSHAIENPLKLQNFQKKIQDTKSSYLDHVDSKTSKVKQV